tara:strand:+ start:252 stop:782 length:531 start_codon:yes stop_codon:yes gene_type:complete
LDGPLKSAHFQAASTVFDTDLLAAAGDRKSIVLLSIDAEALSQLIHAAEVGTLVVDTTAARTGVVVDAPTIGSHHLQVLSLLLRCEGLQRFAPLLRIQPATGTATTDALPAVTGRHSLVPAQGQFGSKPRRVTRIASLPHAMGIDFSLIANFAALALIALAGPAVVFILFYRRGAL